MSACQQPPGAAGCAAAAVRTLGDPLLRRYVRASPDRDVALLESAGTEIDLERRKDSLVERFAAIADQLEQVCWT